jgi:RNA polymerase sigma factor (sigma-70 family)
LDATPLTNEQQRIVEENLPLLYYVAKDYRHVPEDVFQGIISRLHYRLCVCAQKFDPDRGNKISSYIVYCLKGEIKNYFRDESWVIRPPRKLREMSFSSAVDNNGEELSAAELHGENPHTIGSCAIPVPLHAITASNREEGDYDLDIPSDENVERDVTDRLGGRLIVREVMAALRLEERIILALQMKKRPVKEIQHRFQLSRSEAGQARAEVRTKAGRLYQQILDGITFEPSDGSEVLKKAIRKRFRPEAVNYLEIRERIVDV